MILISGKAPGIHDSYLRHVAPTLAVDVVVVSGGGGRNPEILRRLADRTAGPARSVITQQPPARVRQPGRSKISFPRQSRVDNLRHRNQPLSRRIDAILLKLTSSSKGVFYSQ